jgi:hypothetical protein
MNPAQILAFCRLKFFDQKYTKFTVKKSQIIDQNGRLRSSKKPPALQRENPAYPNIINKLSFLNQCCGSGSGFNGVPESISGSAIRIRIQEGKNYPQTLKKI